MYIAIYYRMKKNVNKIVDFFIEARKCLYKFN